MPKPIRCYELVTVQLAIVPFEFTCQQVKHLLVDMRQEADKLF